MREWSGAGIDERWSALGWTPRAARLFRALLWTIAWIVVLNTLQSVLPAVQSSTTGAPSCRSRPCVVMAPLAPS